jgi:hypothetical protein
MHVHIYFTLLFDHPLEALGTFHFSIMPGTTIGPSQISMHCALPSNKIGHNDVIS